MDPFEVSQQMSEDDSPPDATSLYGQLNNLSELLIGEPEALQLGTLALIAYTQIAVLERLECMDATLNKVNQNLDWIFAAVAR